MAQRCPTAARLHVFAVLLAALSPLPASAGEARAPAEYARPSAEIAAALDARPVPFVEASPDGRYAALLFRRPMPPAADLNRPVLGLAGRLIDPANNGPARGILFDRVSVLIPGGGEVAIALPAKAQLSTVRWSPDGSRLAFLNHAKDSIELWTLEAKSGSLRLIARDVNATFAEPFAWLPDSSGFLLRLVPPGRGEPPRRPAVPSGPEIRESDARPVPVQTLSNVLQDTYDDSLFRHYFTSQLMLAGVDGSALRPLGTPAIVHRVSVAPDGRHVLVERLLEPFSRSFTAPDFPREIAVLEVADGSQRQIASLPGADRAERLPDGADSGPRAMGWRPDEPATVTWIEAAGERGQVIDRLHRWQAPFAHAPQTIATIEGRIVRAFWDGPHLAVLEIRPPDGGGSRRVMIDPARIGQLVAAADLPPRDDGQRLLTVGGSEGSARLAVSDAGLPLVLDDANGSATDRILELNPGAGAQRPIHEFPSPGQTQRIAAVLDPHAGTVLAWRESATQPPNLFLLNGAGRSETQLTYFPDPAPAFADMKVVPLSYRRKDGVALTARLYLPAALAGAAPRPLATLFWAYPVITARSPAQSGDRSEVPSRFVRPSGVDPLLLTARGYAVVVADMPVVVAEDDNGEADLVEQLVANASAAIDAGFASGWVDREQVAVAGHSFGAGMALNLLANSELFAAGIAMSGAYNRTLTPFGFQTERRSLWEAPELYRQASPFMRADAIEAPLLLIHGMQDTNSGTLPMQSERLFAALQGMGKPARLVLLPGEGHEYTARESVFHVLFEIENWLDRFLKPGLANSAPIIKSENE